MTSYTTWRGEQPDTRLCKCFWELCHKTESKVQLTDSKETVKTQYQTVKFSSVQVRTHVCSLTIEVTESMRTWMVKIELSNTASCCQYTLELIYNIIYSTVLWHQLLQKAEIPFKQNKHSDVHFIQCFCLFVFLLLFFSNILGSVKHEQERANAWMPSKYNLKLNLVTTIQCRHKMTIDKLHHGIKIWEINWQN